MALDRVKIAKDRNWTVREVYKAIDCWRAMKKRQPESSMSIEEYLDLISASGLRPDMIGLRRGKYSIARFNDLGAYDLDNCRFILIEDNVAERKEGYQKHPEFRVKMSIISKARKRIACGHCGKIATKQMFARWHGNKCKAKNREVYT